MLKEISSFLQNELKHGMNLQSHLMNRMMSAVDIVKWEGDLQPRELAWYTSFRCNSAGE
jgi:hypothetical protein